MKFSHVPFWLWAGLYGAVLVLLTGRFDASGVMLVVGILLAGVIVFVDRWLQVVLLRPHEQLSRQVMHVGTTRGWWSACRLLWSRGGEQQHLTVRSVFFMGVWVPVALFVLTSSSSLLADGMVLGLGLYLVYEVWSNWQEIERLRTLLFWPVRRYVRETEIRSVILLFTAFFILMHFWLL